MSTPELQYRIQVAPGILQDGTFGVYAIPDDNPATEIQVDAQFATSEDAMRYAESYRRKNSARIREQTADLRPEREPITLSNISHLTEAVVETALSRVVVHDLEAIKGFNLKKFFTISPSTPYLLSWIVLAAWWFSFSIPVPEWLPGVGEYIGGREFSPKELAAVFPYALCLVVLYVYAKTRVQTHQYSHTADLIIWSATVYGWRRTDYVELLLRTISSEGHGWLLKVAERLERWSSNTPAQENPQEPARVSREQALKTVHRIIDEDFESRIHALACMSREGHSSHSYVVFDPLYFVCQIGRAETRIKRTAEARDGTLQAGLGTLPTKTNRAHRRLFVLTLVNSSVLAAALGISVSLSSPTTALSWTPTLFAFVLSIAPPLVWNYNVLLKHRGLPRGWSLIDMAEPGVRIVKLL